MYKFQNYNYMHKLNIVTSPEITVSASSYASSGGGDSMQQQGYKKPKILITTIICLIIFIIKYKYKIASIKETFYLGTTNAFINNPWKLVELLALRLFLYVSI